MSEQQRHNASSHTDGVPWWVRLCRWLWKLAGFLGTSVLLALVVNIVSTWLTTPKGAFLNDTPLSFLITYWPLSLSVGCGLLLLAVLIWSISRWNSPLSGTITLQEREHTLRRLHAYYKQWHSQSLHGAVQMELGLLERPAAIYQTARLALRLPSRPEQILPAHTSIVEAYKEYAQQELLILGETGAGKSTLLLELADYLVKQAEQDTRQPLPVILPLSSWASRRSSLQDWLIEQFAQIYVISQKLSQQLVYAGQVLPLLDGLDEMSEGDRPACIAAINSYHREHVGPLVVCSRTNDYDQATKRERLVLHTAVVVQPLSPEQVDTHLASLGKPTAALRTAITMNPTLAGLATIPLMLQILILTYYGTPVKLLAHKQEELQRQVWATFIEHMVERKGDATRYPLDHTIPLLGWLARQMRGGNFSFFEDADTADALLPRTYYTCSAWSVGLISPLVLGLGCALGALVILPSRLGFGRLIFGLIIGLIIGLSQLGGELDFLRDQSLSPQQWKDFRKDVWVPLFYPVIGLVGGLVVWLVLSLVNRLLFGLFGDSIAWLVGGPIGGPVAWLVGGVIIGLLVVLNVLSFIFVPHLAFRFWLWCSPLSPEGYSIL